MITLHANKPYHFLLVHCNSYDDGISVILSSQCIQAIVTQFPQAKVSLLLHSSMRDFFLNHPNVYQIFCIDTSPNIAKELKHAKINISLSIIADKTSTIALFRAGVKMRIGVFSHFYSLLFNYKIKQKRTLQNKHESVYNLDILRSVQCKQFIYPKLFLKISDIDKAQQIITKKFGEQALHGFIAICPSYGLRKIGWKAKNFFAIANAIATFHNVLILAPMQEMESYRALLPQFPNLSAQHCLFQEDYSDISISQTTLLLSLIRLSRLFIGNNTTLLHAAAALDICTFALLPYKNTLNPHRYAPISANAKHVICTPFGIFSHQDQANPINQTDTHGFNMESISTDVALSILQAKFFPNERLFIEPIAPQKTQEANKSQNIMNQDAMNQTLEQQATANAEQTLPQEIRIAQNTPYKEGAHLDIQEGGFTPQTQTSIIDERG